MGIVWNQTMGGSVRDMTQKKKNRTSCQKKKNDTRTAGENGECTIVTTILNDERDRSFI